MKTKWKIKYLRYALMALAACFLCVFSALCSLKNNAVYAEENENTNLYIGDVIEAAEYQFSSQSGVKAEELVVVYPNGSVYGGDDFTIQQAGKYKVTYYATVSGARVEETQEYLALRKPKDIIVAEAGMDVRAGKYEVESPYKMKKDTYGTLVTFKSGQSITFSTNIKTAKLTEDYNIVDLIVMPSVFKETDFKRLTVRVADAGDANNYVEVIIDSSNMQDGGGQVSYVKAGANGQKLGGYEGQEFHSDDIYGAQIEHSFRAFGYVDNVYIPGEDPRFNEQNYTISENSITVAIDHESKKVYCGPATGSTDKIFVNDLDDPTHYKGNPWGGFTSDEVVVTLTAGSFDKMEGKVLLKTFGDFDLAKDIEDTIAPEIFVDYDTTQKMPVAIVGEKFPMFPYTVRDGLDKDVISGIWVYYKDKQGNNITVANDGEGFVPQYAGEYEIIYYAKDATGNYCEKTITLTAVEKTPNIFISAFEIAEKQVYETVIIPTAEQVQAFGGSGYLSVERAVYSPDNQLLDVKDKLQFTLLGDYKIVYTVTDYLGNVEHAIVTAKSLALDAPTFVEEPILDDYLIAGFTYDFSNALAVETLNGEVIKLPYKTYVNGQLANGSFKAEGTNMTIRYVAEGSVGTTPAVIEKTVTVLDPEKGKHKDRYFYYENIAQNQINPCQDYLELHFNEDSATGFINPLYSNGFSLSMSYEQDKADFTSILVTLTDAENRSRQVTLYFSYDAATNKWFLQLNGNENRIAFTTSERKTDQDVWETLLVCSLAASGDKIVDASGVGVATIVYYDNGEHFEGFSDTLYLYVQFEGVESESMIRINQICNQSMGYVKNNPDRAEDSVKPVIFLQEEFQLRQNLGEKAKIPTAKAFDVLGQIAQFTVTVELGGETLASGDATKPLDLVLTKAGYYNVLYYAKDSNGNPEKKTYVIFVKDETAPTLTVDNNLTSEYKVGDKITIPGYSASDNNEKYSVQVTLILPDNEMRLLQYNENGEITSLLDKENDLYESSFKASADTFVTQKKGKYVLRIVAYDEYYNYTVVEIEFMVK